ncbi:PIR protein [Plasmodium yoelii]|uniref:PIR protein n=2 Tax=Plasmodium yoelii TaxID=5861 RepID=A0AAF0B173_PLAYO|nr:PIR protein [Plasmodium yoelii]WBY54616.1 PIR protein [Plasmodium yoelii yoelii]VTZ71610.1 PIR protein [Plasmodium yoelii]|eukprot:XP_034493337.1 PIR protein [Plasmodium yoelii]
MNKQVCNILISTSNSFSSSLDSKKNYQFNMNEGIFSKYCTSNNCSTNHEKINAGFLYLFDAFFKDSKLFESVTKSNINIVEYIMIWLSKILKLIEPKENESLDFLYEIYIKNDDRYKNTINKIEGCSNYKELIDKTKMMKMDIKDISKLYDAFTTLCMMYIEFNETSPDCKNCLKRAETFVKQYNQLNNNSDISNDSPYYRLLSTLSNDYDNFKKNYSDVKCSNSSSFPKIEKPKNYVQSFGGDDEQTVQILEQISEDASSSSITNRLFIVLSIFGAIAFFLGISYKYSLFGFRKRFQKQKLREKLKNIKKRMNQ